MLPADQEECGLGQGVVDGVQHRAEDARSAQADAEGQDAHVLDARVGEHPLEVGLAEDENGRDQPSTTGRTT